MCKIICRYILYSIRKVQIVQVNKRQLPNLTSHIGFNSLHDKRDKFVGGICTIILVLLVLLPSSIINSLTWFYDKKPYISSNRFEVVTEGEFERQGRVTLD